ncbi:MAG: hypothetical protein EB059_09160 [Alphaproteobacteria bacterium]|nr:hypothetical protein [Alphaproteobacteria bacterium]
MFGLAWPELLLIGAVAVIAIGPKDIPPLMRQAGAWSRKARLMMHDFQKHFDSMGDDLPNQVDITSMQREADELQKKAFEKYGVDITTVDPHADHDEDEQHIAAALKSADEKKLPPS